jgi:hypothetical protein
MLLQEQMLYMIPEIRTDAEKIQRKTGEANEVLSNISTY